MKTSKRTSRKGESPTFARAHAQDIPILIEMLRDLYAFDRIVFYEERARRALAEILGDDTLGRVWLIRMSEKIVGYIVLTLGFSLEFHGRDAVIGEIFVLEKYRRQGIGRRAIEFIEAACRRLGVHAIHLVVERANTQAQRVYRSAGFESFDRTLMSKRLKLPKEI